MRKRRSSNERQERVRESIRKRYVTRERERERERERVCVCERERKRETEKYTESRNERKKKRKKVKKESTSRMSLKSKVVLWWTIILLRREAIMLHVRLKTVTRFLLLCWLENVMYGIGSCNICKCFQNYLLLTIFCEMWLQRNFSLHSNQINLIFKRFQQ